MHKTQTKNKQSRINKNNKACLSELLFVSTWCSAVFWTPTSPSLPWPMGNEISCYFGLVLNWPDKHKAMVVLFSAKSLPTTDIYCIISDGRRKSARRCYRGLRSLPAVSIWSLKPSYRSSLQAYPTPPAHSDICKNPPSVSPLQSDHKLTCQDSYRHAGKQVIRMQAQEMGLVANLSLQFSLSWDLRAE